MDFFTVGEVLFSVLYAAAFGIICGAFIIAVSVAVDCIESVAFLPAQIIPYAKNPKKLSAIFKGNFEMYRTDSKVKLFFKDFVCVLCCGVAFSILLYVSVDGVFRFYILFISLALMYASVKLLGVFFEKMTLKTVKFIFSLCIIVFSLLFAPFVLFMRKMHKNKTATTNK